MVLNALGALLADLGLEGAEGAEGLGVPLAGVKDHVLVLESKLRTPAVASRRAEAPLLSSCDRVGRLVLEGDGAKGRVAPRAIVAAHVRALVGRTLRPFAFARLRAEAPQLARDLRVGLEEVAFVADLVVVQQLRVRLGHGGQVARAADVEHFSHQAVTPHNALPVVARHTRWRGHLASLFEEHAWDVQQLGYCLAPRHQPIVLLVTHRVGQLSWPGRVGVT